MEFKGTKRDFKFWCRVMSPVCGVIASAIMLGDWINIKVLSAKIGVSALKTTAVLKATHFILKFFPIPAVITDIFSDVGRVSAWLVKMAIICLLCHCGYIFKCVVKKEYQTKSCVILGSLIALVSLLFIVMISKIGILKMTALPYLCFCFGILEVFFALYPKYNEFRKNSQLK